MRLATRLFLIVGSLLLLICLIVYLVPYFLTKRESKRATESYFARLEERQAETHRERLGWLDGQLAEMEATIDSVLYSVARHPPMAAMLRGSPKEGNFGAWYGAAYLLYYGSYCDLLTTTYNNQVAAGITWAKRHPKKVERIPISGQKMAWITEVGPKYQAGQAYIGVLLPDVVAQLVNVYGGVHGGWDIYLLFDPHNLMNQHDLIKNFIDQKGEEISKRSLPILPEAGQGAILTLKAMLAAAQWLQKEYGSDSQGIEKLNQKIQHLPTSVERESSEEILAGGEKLDALAGKEGLVTTATFSDAFVDAVEMLSGLELALALTLPTMAGQPYENPLTTTAPLAAAHFPPPAVSFGYMVFSRDIFSLDFLFDGARHLRADPPILPRIPIGSGFSLISWGNPHFQTIINSLNLGSIGSQAPGEGFLNLGFSTQPLLNRMMAFTGDTVLLFVDGKVASVVPGTRVPYTSDLGTALEKEIGQITKSFGFIDLNENKYYYMYYPLRKQWDTSIITLMPGTEILNPIRSYIQDNEEFFHRTALQIVIGSICLFIIALIILEFIARHFTRPIRELAHISDQIGAGRFDQISLPTTAKGSKDEVSRLTEAFRGMVHGLEEREKIRSILQKVVSKEVASEILGGKVHLGGEVRNVTVLFSDIRNFTQISSNLPPTEVIAFVNSYMTAMTEIIEMHQGVIDKYVGDEIMALFGAPVTHRYGPLQGVAAALSMLQRLKSWNLEREKKGLFTIEAGTAVLYGEMVVGNMGAEARLDYTVMGANVNLASRMVSKAKGMEILITEPTCQLPQIHEIIELETLEPIMPKGFSEPIQVYKVMGIKPGYHLDQLTLLVGCPEEELVLPEGFPPGLTSEH